MGLFGRLKRAATSAIAGFAAGGPVGAALGAAGGALSYSAPSTPKRTPAQQLAQSFSGGNLSPSTGGVYNPGPVAPRNPYQSSGPGLDAGDILQYFDKQLGGIPSRATGAIQRAAAGAGYNQQAGNILSQLGPTAPAPSGGSGVQVPPGAKGMVDEYGRPIVTGFELQTRAKAPKGYVVVTNPETGMKVAMLREVAIKLKYYKPRKKPYISYSDMKALRKAESVKKKVNRAATAADFVCRKKKT